MNGGFCRFWLVVTGKGEENSRPICSADWRLEQIATSRSCAASGSETQSSRRSDWSRWCGWARPCRPRMWKRSACRSADLHDFPGSYAMVIDDLEGARRGIAEAVYARYRGALDTILSPVGWQTRASVQFSRQHARGLLLRPLRSCQFGCGRCSPRRRPSHGRRANRASQKRIETLLEGIRRS